MMADLPPFSILHFPFSISIDRPGQLMAPRNTGLWLVTLSRVFVFGIESRLFIAGIIPVVPTFGTDMRAHVAILEDRLRIRAPRTTEITLCDAGSSRQCTVVEDIAAGLAFRCTGSGDITVDLTVKDTVLKPCLTRTEDKVRRSLDIAMVEEKRGADAAGIDGILIAEETAVAEDEMAALRMEGDSLTETRGVVLNGEVLQCDGVAVDTHGEGTEGSHLLVRTGDGHVRVIAPRDDGGITVFTAELDVRQPRGDDEFLVIGSFLDKDHLMIVHESATDFHGIGDGMERGTAVLCDKQGIGVVIRVGSGGHEGCKKEE